jgi:alpha-tubulin suppressor-like RCC1 family protein
MLMTLYANTYILYISVCSSGLIRVIGECGELARQVPPLKQGEDYNEGNITRYHLTPGFMYTSFITASNAVVQNSREIRNAKAIGCGAYHSLLVLVNSPQTSMMMNDDDEDSSCCLFTTGLNNYGQLGVGDMNNRAFLTAVHLSENVQIMQVKGGVHHSLALASTGEVFAWGRSDSGQLGLDKTSHVAAGACVCTPEPVKVGTDEVRIIAVFVTISVDISGYFLIESIVDHVWRKP